METVEICIEEMCDGFDVIVDDERFHFDQEDSKEKLVDVFKKLGLKASYEVAY